MGFLSFRVCVIENTMVALETDLSSNSYLLLTDIGTLGRF